MKPITAPLKLGQTGTEVNNLQEILLLLITHQVINIDGKETLIDRLAEERTGALLGSATNELVMIFRALHSETDSSGPEIVNTATMNLLNSLLNQIEPPMLTVSGYVRHPSGKQLQGNYVAAVYLLAYPGERLLGNVNVSEDGAYRCLVAIAAGTPNYIDIARNNGIRVKVTDALTDIQVVVQDSYTTGASFVLDLVLEGNDIVVATEYEEVGNALQAAIGAPNSIQEIDLTNEDGLTSLATNTGETTQTIRNLVIAHQLHTQIPSIVVDIFYALLRQQLPDTIVGLSTQTSGTLFSALKVAVVNHIIAERNDATLLAIATAALNSVNEYLLTGINAIDPKESGLYRIAITATEGDAEQAGLMLQTYHQWNASSSAPLAEMLHDAGVPDATTIRFENALRIMVLTGNNGLLTDRLTMILKGVPAGGDPVLEGAGEGAAISLLTKLSLTQWNNVIDHIMTNPGFFFPDFLEEGTDDTRKNAYAVFLQKQFDLAAPTHAAATAIAADTTTPFAALKASLQSFLSNNPTFDLRTVPLTKLSEPDAFSFVGIEDKDAFIQEAGIVQRLMNVTDSYPVMAALAADGLHSSIQISRQSPAAFIDTYQLVAGGADAAQSILDAAVQTTNVAFNAVIDFAQLADGTAFALTQNDPANAFAEWRTLFGSIDSCNCSQCQSVYSPAAYLTDLLQFLKNNLKPAYDVLMERRPDIKDIDLVCKNINTPVPHIDIVNELLEDLVSAVGYTKDSANDYQASSYKMYARQTGADAKVQRAIPEHINTNPASTGMKLKSWNGSAYDDVLVKNPYDQLKDAVYPASVPYNFYKRQIETHLGIAGVKGYELVQRFSNQHALEIWTDQFAAAEYAGISKQELALITVSDANPYKKYGLLVNVVYNPNGEDLYYIADPAARGSLYPAGGLPFQIVGGHHPELYARSNWVEHLGYRVDVFLQQAQITYPELQTILDCYCINPFVSSTARKMADVGNDLASNDNPCDLSKRQIQGLDMEAVDRIYRFIRLRKALGWSYYELDQAMIAMAGLSDVNARTQAGTIQINEALFCQLVQIGRLAQLLNIAVADIIFLWKDLDDILLYSNYEREERELIPSRYQQMFLNPLVGNNELTLFPVDASQLDIAALNTTKDAFYNYLSGILGIETQDLGLLIHSVFEVDSIPATGLPLAQLSKLYREVILMNALNLSVTEWIQYKSWIAIDGNFNTASSLTSEAYEKTASPFTTPNDAIRFVDFVTTVKEAGMDIADVGYLLLDSFADPVDETTQNGLLQTSLTALRTALQQKSAPSYTAETDMEGEKLKPIVALIADADTTDYLIKVIHDDAAISTDTLTDRIEFLEDSTLAFSPLQSQALTNYTTDVKVRRQLVYDTLKSRIEKASRLPSVTNYLAKELKLDEAMITVLLEDCIEVDTAGAGPVPAMDLLLDTHFIDSNAVIERSETTTVLIPQLVAYVRLQKAAWLINKFNLDLQDISNIWGHDALLAGVFRLSTLRVAVTTGTASIPDVAVTDKTPFYEWLGFLRWMHVISFLGKNKNLLYKALRDIPQPLVPTNITVRKERTLQGISKAFSMPVDDLSVLVGDADTLTGGAFNATFSTDITLPNDYTAAVLYLRIIRCLEMQHLLPARMSVLSNVAISIVDPADQKTANELIQVVKAQYDDDQWLKVVRPVSDQLRIERRDAMVAYLLAYQPWPYKNKWLTSNDIFETLMLDVDMMTCMSTTRVLLAVNTIQLWVDRVLLGLEKYSIANGSYEPLILSAPQARQWNMWRKLYRVWEANRKIFIYPENWIEPELRDDKSPFFKELEKFLKQNDLTADNVEEAYKTYLERLEEVAHLEVIGIHREMNAAGQVVVHAFGRTASNPHVYFYRKRIDTEWTPWEKMEVQIDGDHFIPLVWRGRLRFYWLTFMKEQKDEGTSNIKNSNTYPPPAPVRWKISLCFTELKNGKWTSKQVGKDNLYSNYLIEEDPISQDHVNEIERGLPTDDDPNRSWFLKGTLDKQRSERLSFSCGLNKNGDLQFFLSERIKLISQHAMFVTMVLYDHSAISNGPYTRWANGGDFYKALDKMRDEEFYTSTLIKNIGTFTHKYGGIITDRNYPEQHNIYADAGDEEYLASAKDLCHHNYSFNYTRYAYSKKYIYNNKDIIGYYHFPDAGVQNRDGIQLLGKAPDINDPSGKIADGKYLIFPLQKPEGYVEGTPISFPSFFFADYKNNFYVEKVYVENVFRSGTNNSEDRPIQYGKPLPKTSLLYRTQYHFQEFSHGTVDNFRECLYKNGLDALLNRDFINQLSDEIGFSTAYSPTTYVLQGTNGTKYPNSKVDFSLEGAYSLYNWELFFHIPMLIANKLTQDQKFDEARKWYHYVFNPTVGGSSDVKNFWNFPEFNKNAHSIPTPLQLMRDPQLGTAVARWANDPFKPHLIARTRISAYMKNTFMKYLDNLIAWGDNLYRSDTRENINEATLLYVLAAQLMGRKPVNMSAKSTPDAQSYISLAYLAATNGLNTGGLNAFSNGVLYAENLLLSTGATSVSVVPQPGTPSVLTDSMFYFCIPANDKLRGYWDIIADRLFKIRHCQNIDGVERELALYDPPIDPALLVKAAAAGISLSDVLADINAPIPAYRFNVMSQKATELTQEVKSLGGQLLSALEKKDAEKISLLRSGQELRMLTLVTEVKEQQIQDSVTQINGLQQQQKLTTQRRDYYSRLIDSGLNVQEQLQLDSLQTSIPLTLAQGSSQTLAGIVGMIPNVKIGATDSGPTFGGDNLNSAANAAASAFGTAANVNSTIGQMAATKGGYVRRKEDWAQQLKTAETELKQLDHQILGAQIRQAMAELELRNHKTQMANAQQMDEAMRNKYTNEELYDWMVGEVSLTYFQAYKLAMDVAKRAERCYRYELGMESSDFIQPTYWDSLKKGLLAGEQLMFDVKRMEVSFLDKNKRQLELTKHVSLAQLCPDELLKLKTGKQCDISIPEWLFDMDYPGQHLRRIKSVSVSIPCVAGPYTTVSCKLSLVSSKYRKSSIMINNYNHEDNFKQLYGSIQSIATSSAQNDSGMFEFSFRDERYLPFEGAGAVSKWRIELPAVYAQFDYNSISDVILHINYTALDEGSLKEKAGNNVKKIQQSAAEDNGFMRLFNVRHEFADEWFAYSEAIKNDPDAKLTIRISDQHFPYYTHGKQIEVRGVQLGLKSGATLTGRLELQYRNGPVYKPSINVATVPYCPLQPAWKIEGNTKILKMQLFNTASAPVNLTNLLDDLYLVVVCRLKGNLTGPVNDDADWGEVPTSVIMSPEPVASPVFSAIPGDGKITLAWTNSGAGITYLVERSLKSTFPSYATKMVYSGTDLTTAVEGLTNGKPVYFRIKAMNDEGNPDSTYGYANAAPFETHPVAWWMADGGIVNAPDGTKVTQWYDQSGKGQALHPASDTTRPSLGTDTLNGIRPVVFNGDSGLYTGPFQDTNDVTVSVLVKMIDTTETGILGRNSQQAIESSWAIWFFDYQYQPFSVSGGVFNPNYSDLRTPYTNGSWDLLTFRRDSNTGFITIWKNGAWLNDFACGNSFAQINLPISMGSLGVGSNYGHFSIMETMIYDKALTDAEVLISHKYLNTKYGLQLTLPLAGNMLAWWKADAPNNELIGNELNVWKDQSGKVNDISAVDATKRPVIISNWKNGKPALNFNGGQALRKAMFNLPANTVDISVFLAGKKKATNAQSCVFELSDNMNISLNGIGFFTNQLNIDQAVLRAGGEFNIHGIPMDLANDIPGIYELGFNLPAPDPETSVTFNGIRYAVPYGDSYPVQADHFIEVFQSNPLSIGARGGYDIFAHFELAEMIIIPYKVTDAERTSITNYLKAKYAL